MADAVGLVDGLYPGAAAQGFGTSRTATTTDAPRISEVYTKGTLTLARLGREAPIAAASPAGPALRNPAGSLRPALYPESPDAARSLPRSPIIGTDSPVQYEHDETRARKRMPAGPPARTPQRPSRRHVTDCARSTRYRRED